MRFLYLLLFFSLSAAAELSSPESWEALKAFGDRFRFGLEIEAVGSPMERVLPHFEYEALMKSLPASYYKWSSYQLNQYLEREGNFETLPASVQAYLLKKKGANESIKKAWSKLSYKTKASYVQPSRMPLSVLSHTLANFAAALKLREDAPPALKDIMSRMVIEPDAVGPKSIFEFKYNESIKITDPVQYLRDLSTLTELLGVRSMMDDPVNKTPGVFSYHIHISKNDGVIEDGVLHAFNFKRMLDFAERNPGGVFSETSTVAYQTDLSRKGLIRRIASNRVELRYHDGDPVNELRSMLALLSLPEKEAVERLAAQAAEKFTPELIQKMAKFRPEVVIEYLRHIHPHLPPEKRIYPATLLASIQAGAEGSPHKRRFVKALSAALATRDLPDDSRAILKTLVADSDPAGVYRAQNFVSAVVQKCRLLFSPLAR